MCDQLRTYTMRNAQANIDPRTEFLNLGSMNPKGWHESWEDGVLFHSKCMRKV